MVRKTKSKSEETIEEPAEVTKDIHSEEMMNEPSAGAIPPSTSKCGGVLKHTRETQNLSIQDISSQLRLSPKQVEAIEADEFEKLPEPTIVRGFIRNYAKLLKIDAQPLLANYSEIAPDNSPKSFAVKSNANTSIVIGESKTGFSPAIFITLLIIFLIIGGIFYYYTQKTQPITSETTTNLTPQTAHDNDAMNAPVEFALPPAERTQDSNDEITDTTEDNLIVAPEDATVIPIQLPTPAPTNNTSNADTSPSSPATDLAPPAAAITQTETTTQVNGEQTGLAKLHITAAEESWINVIDASGKEVYSQILPAGSSRTIQAKPTLNITIGNASATTLTMNGKTIDLAPHTRDKVAHIKLD